MTDEQIDALAKAGANAFANDVHGRSGFDNILDEAGYYAADEPESLTVSVSVRVARVSISILLSTSCAGKSTQPNIDEPTRQD